jgi:hypothetical protein
MAYDTPIQKAKALCKGLDFAALLDAHALHGCIYCGPDAFGLVRPVNLAAPMREVLDPWKVHESPNAWWITLAVGRLPRLLSLLPYALPRIAWERRDRVITWPLETLLRKCGVSCAVPHGNGFIQPRPAC